MERSANQQTWTSTLDYGWSINEQAGDLLSEVSMEAQVERSLDLCPANGWVWNELEYVCDMRCVSDMQLDVDHYAMSLVQAVLAARGLVP